MIQEVTSQEPKDQHNRFERNRRRLRNNLIEPLITSGLRRPKAMKQVDFEVLLIKICDRLWWVPDDLLDVLVDTFEREAAGKVRPEFPTVGHANSIARGLAEAHGIVAPTDLPRIVKSYMRSRAGQEAWSRDPLEAMALFWFLNKRLRPPTSAYYREEIENVRSTYARRLRETEGVDDLAERDRQWLEWYEERRSLVEHLIFGGEHD